MTDSRKTRRIDATRKDGISRRQFLASGATFAFAAAVTGPGLTILSSCGSEGGNGGEGGGATGPLKFWQFHAPGGQVESREQWFVDTVDAWNEENETQVELQYIPVQDYLEGSKLQTAFSAGEGPDIFVISPGDFLRYYNGGVLQDLTPFMDQEAQDDFFPSVMATRTVDGKVYGLPMEVDPMAMYYSVQAFEEAGLSESDIPETWDQLLDVAERLRKGDRFGVLFETNPGYYQNFTWYPFMWMGGGDAVAEDGDTSNFDTQGTVQALQFWQDAIKSGVAPRKALGTGGNDAAANLGSGYCAIQNVGIWAISQLRENTPDFEYGIFKLPLPPGGSYTTDLGGWAFVANSKGKNPEAAAEFCVWALGSMSEDSIKRATQWITEADTGLAPRKSVTEQATEKGVYDSGPLRVFQEEIFPGGRGEPRYPPDIFKAVSDAIQACQLDGADPAQQAGQTAQRINSFLEGYSGAKIT